MTRAERPSFDSEFIGLFRLSVSFLSAWGRRGYIHIYSYIFIYGMVIEEASLRFTNRTLCWVPTLDICVEYLAVATYKLSC